MYFGTEDAICLPTNFEEYYMRFRTKWNKEKKHTMCHCVLYFSCVCLPICGCVHIIARTSEDSCKSNYIPFTLMGLQEAANFEDLSILIEHLASSDIFICFRHEPISHQNLNLSWREHTISLCITTIVLWANLSKTSL